MALILELTPDVIRRKVNVWRFEHFQKGRHLEKSSIAAFDYYKCIFVHIPKTGGVSVNDALWGNPGGVHKSMEEYARIFSRKTLEQYYKFAFVRNPWDRLVSAYAFLKTGGLHKRDARWAKRQQLDFDNFERFVMEWVSRDNICKGIHFIPQTAFLTLDGKIAVDFIGRFENFQSDFEFIKDKLVIPEATLEHRNRSVRKDYKAYYTAETRQKVAEVYADDIRILGYAFE
jgi:hypothetical protein